MVNIKKIRRPNLRQKLTKKRPQKRPKQFFRCFAASEGGYPPPPFGGGVPDDPPPSRSSKCGKIAMLKWVGGITSTLSMPSSACSLRNYVKRWLPSTSALPMVWGPCAWLKACLTPKRAYIVRNHFPTHWWGIILWILLLEGGGEVPPFNHQPKDYVKGIFFSIMSLQKISEDKWVINPGKFHWNHQNHAPSSVEMGGPWVSSTFFVQSPPQMPSGKHSFLFFIFFGFGLIINVVTFFLRIAHSNNSFLNWLLLILSLCFFFK